MRTSASSEPRPWTCMFENQLKDIGQRYGLGGMVDGQGGYGWGGAEGTQFWLDRKNNLYGLFMVRTQGYRGPTVNEFRRLTNVAIDATFKPASLRPTAEEKP